MLRRIVIAILLVMCCCGIAYADDFDMRYTDYPAGYNDENKDHSLSDFDAESGGTVNLAKDAGLRAFYYDSSDAYFWETSDSGTAEITSTGEKNGKSYVIVRARAAGEARISLKRQDGEEMTGEAEFTVNVTEPDVPGDLKDLRLVTGSKVELVLTGTTTSPKKAVDIPSESKTPAYVKKGYIYCGNRHTGSYDIYVDGGRITCSARTNDVKIKARINAYNHRTEDDYVYALGMPEYMTYVLKGKRSRMKPVLRYSDSDPAFVPSDYTSSNRKVARITKSGVITARRKGWTVIKCKVCGVTVRSKIYVVSRKQMKALKKGFKMADMVWSGKLKYSRSKRMKKGYADCSSFVYRAAKAGGCTFGGATSGGGEYRWCRKKGYIIKGRKYKKALPCDIIFFKNGKYNYGHVEMAVGYNTSVGIGAGFGLSHLGILNRYCPVRYIARPIK